MLSYREPLLKLLDELHELLLLLPTEPELAVHGTRKRTKHLRAVLNLLPEPTPVARKSLRQLSCKLAPLREAQVDRETLQVLALDHPVLRAALYLERLDQVHQHGIAVAQQAIGQILPSYFRSIQSQFGELPQALDRQTIAIGLERAYEKAASKFSTTLNNNTSKTIHGWRKKVKRLWYQGRFIWGDLPADPIHPVNQSNELGKLLGEIHDLDVCLTHFPAQSFPELPPIIIRERQALMSRAIPLGKALHHQNGKVFRQYITHFTDQN